MSKLSIKEEMRAIDTKDRSWYNSLTDEERKKVGIWVLMRYTSSCKHDIKDFEEYYLEMVNDFVNVNFNSLAKHPQLQFQLLQLCGIGKPQFHPWIAPGKKGKSSTNDLEKWIRNNYSQYNEDEIEVLLKVNTKQDWYELFEDHGMDKKEQAKILGAKNKKDGSGWSDN